MKKRFLAGVAIVLSLTFSTQVFADVNKIYKAEFKTDIEGSFVWNNLDEIQSATPDNCSFTVTLDYEIPKEKKYELYVSFDDEAEKKIVTAYLQPGRKERKLTYKFPKLDYGTYTVKIRGELDGKTVNEWSETLAVIKKYEPQFMEEYSISGANLHVGRNDNWAPEGIVDILKNAGILRYRDGIAWYTVEDGTNEKGAITEDKIKSLPRIQWYYEAKENGLNGINLLNGLPTTYYNEDDPAYNSSPTTTDNISGYANYATKTVEYSGVDFYDSIEFLNEPNGPNYPAAKYTNLVMMAVNSLKRLGYDGNLAAFSLYNHREDEWAEENYDSGIYPYMTSISVHPYGFGSGQDYSDVSTSSEKKIRDQYENMLDVGGWKDLDITEIGSSTHGSAGVTEEAQAINLVKDKFKVDKYNSIGYYIYDLINDDTAPFDREANFGLLRHSDFNRIPKKSYAAYSNLNLETNGALAMGTIDMGKSNGQVLAYVYLKDGKPLVVAWDSNPNDLLDRELEFKGEKAFVIDMYGNELGEVTDSVKLSRKPIYIHGLSNKWLTEAAKNEISKRVNVWLSNYEGSLPENISAKSTFEKVMGNITENSTAKELEESINSLTNLGLKIIECGKNGILSDVEVSKQLFQLYEVMIYVDRLYIALYDGGDVDKLETDIESAKKLASERYWDDWYIMQYSDEILRHAKRLYERANEIMISDKENPMKNGTVKAWDMLSGVLVTWFGEFSKFEHSYNYGLISHIYIDSSGYLDSAYDGENKRVDIRIINKGNSDFKGTLQVFDESGILVYETPQITVDKGKEKDTYIEVICDMISGLDSRKFTINFVNENGYVEATRKHKITISALLESAVLDCAPDETPEDINSVKINVKNLHNIYTSADIEVSSSKNITLAKKNFHIDLSPMEEKVVEVPVSSIENTKFHHYVVDYKISDDEGTLLISESVPLSFVPVVKATKPIDVASWDGSTDDWFDAYPIYRGAVKDAMNSDNIKGADFFARIMKKWDEEHLYILVETYDDAHSVMYTGLNLWDGDALQVSVDTLNDGTNPESTGSSKYRADDYEIGFALTGAGPEAYQWYGPNTIAKGTVDWVKIIRDADTNCTKYLLAIPVEKMDMQKLSENDIVSFNVGMNEGDALGREEYFQITKGTVDAKTPDFYHDYRMILPTEKPYSEGCVNPLP